MNKEIVDTIWYGMIKWSVLELFYHFEDGTPGICGEYGKWSIVSHKGVNNGEKGLYEIWDGTNNPIAFLNKEEVIKYIFLGDWR